MLTLVKVGLLYVQLAAFAGNGYHNLNTYL